MNHVDEDELLAHALEVLRPDAARGIEAHLAACADCRARRERIRRDLCTIGSVRPQWQDAMAWSPSPRRIARHPLLRAAALIVFGIALGVSGSKLVEREPVRVSPAYINPSPPADSIFGYAASDATQADPRL